MTLESRFLEEAPDTVLRDLVEAVVAGYRQAAAVADGMLPNPHRKELLPFIRVKFIDVLVHKFCSKVFPTRTESNDVNNWSYTAVNLPSFKLTVARSEGPSSAPRPSKYREKYALNNDLFSTIEMFPEQLEAELEKLEPNEEVYAVLVHKPTEEDPSIPEFIRVVFPTSDYQSLIGDGIDLLAYTQISPAIETAGTPKEHIEDTIDELLKFRDIQDMVNDD